MKFLLDTNVLIHLLHSVQPLSTNVQKRKPSELGISGFTEAKIHYGIEKSAEQYKMQNQLARVLVMANLNRVYHDQSVSESYGKIKVYLESKKLNKPDNEIDIFIAATAVAKELILVTNNKKDFEHIPNLRLEDWSI